MPTVTIDTSVLPLGDLLKPLELKGFSIAVVTVTDRELTHPDIRPELRNLSAIPETAVWDETPWGGGLYGGTDDNGVERILEIVGSGSFTKCRNTLPPQHMKQ